MISKIEIIKGIGNFEDYRAVGDVSLKKMTLIYAENGAGKTTLARIMQSLASGDATIIDRHRRIGAAGQAEVQIKEDANPSPLRFFNGRWNRTMPHVEVFDSHFVANNVYSGFEISSDHHKGLYQFVVGAAGVSIVNKIERVKNLIAAQNAAISQQAELIRVTASINDVDRFCSLEQKANVDAEIVVKTKELELARQQDQIKTHPLPLQMRLPILSFEYEALKAILQTTVEGIGEEYLAKVAAHLDKLSAQGMEDTANWAFKGTLVVGHSGENHCPFCGQRLDNIDLIKGYNQYFSESYNDAHAAANQAKSTFDGLNIAHYLLQLTTQYKHIEEQMTYWCTILLPDTALPQFPVAELQLEEKYRAVQTVLSQKAKNPVTAVPTDCVEIFNNALGEVYRLCGDVNRFVAEYTTKITDLQNKIQPLKMVEDELKELLIYKARYEDPLKEQCQLYTIMQCQLGRLKAINAHLQQQQKAASAALFQKYGQATNSYLRNVFMTPFQIADVRDVFKGSSRKPNLEYTLLFNGTPILQGDDGSSNTSFKNVLSEGDKNTIAFSFFLAKLTSDPDFANKIVVFDDPLTSLDLNRRNETINQLVFLQSRCKQVIVLSHNCHFLIDLNARNDIKASEKKTLMIIKGGGNARIENYELKREWMDKYKKSIAEMEAFVQNPSPSSQEDAINGIRLTLELMLKLKFCKFVSDQNCTFGDLISILERSSCTFVNRNKVEVISKLRNLNSISWRTHHASVEERAVYSEVTLTIAESVNYVSLALGMLYNEL